VSFPILEVLKVFSKHKINVIRSSLVGTFVGALPAAGGSIANIMSYDINKKSSKHPEKFGTGIPEGIIASEAANNSTIGGSLIPMLAFGIPGDAVTAMILGALLIHGIQPGPLLLQNQPILGNAVFVSVFVAAFLMLIVQSFGLRFFMKINDIPQHYLVPFILALCALGSFAVNNRIFDVWVLLGFGFLGFILKMNKYPLAPVILGVILGPMMEANFRRAMMTSTDMSLFVTRPISLVLLLMAAFSIFYSFYGAHKLKKREMEAAKNIPGQ
ncbi:MAG TPA: Tat pathway signal protein, partial [Clostridia bacterium]|nr:Tat pathway signal protein [Clostridia bacterium]